jgi:CubicO group peptidase (beta-lactamase class C family)
MHKQDAMNRRRFITTSTAALALAPCLPALAGADAKKKLPLGEAFDREVDAFMSARNIPGGALAVVKDRRLVYVRGYGWADREKKVAVGPESLFRIASISKPITAVAVLKLIERGKLSFDTRAFQFLKPTSLLDGVVERRLSAITIRQLLQHTGGWDRSKGFDPMFRSNRIAEATNSSRPATPGKIIEYMLGQPLQFDPGTRYAYSNFDYCLLGRIIEKISGQSYEAFVRENVLAPMGIKRMRIGATLHGKQAEGEVCYYMPDESLASSVFPPPPEKVPWPYGGFHLEAMDAHGGWIASAVDLARFAAAMDGLPRRALLKAEMLREMYAPPPAPVSRTAEGKLEKSYYGCGWMVRPIIDGKASYWHTGSLPGTATLLVRRWDGLSWAVLFNQRSEDRKLPDEAVDAALHRAADAVEKWPDYDLFRQFA